MGKFELKQVYLGLFGPILAYLGQSRLSPEVATEVILTWNRPSLEASPSTRNSNPLVITIHSEQLRKYPKGPKGPFGPLGPYGPGPWPLVPGPWPLALWSLGPLVPWGLALGPFDPLGLGGGAGCLRPVEATKGRLVVQLAERR